MLCCYAATHAAVKKNNNYNYYTIIENEKNNNMKRTQLQHTKYIDINTKRKHIYSNVSIVLLN